MREQCERPDRGECLPTLAGRGGLVRAGGPWAITALIFLLGPARSHGQEDIETRLRRVESELEQQRLRNEQQADRIRELELSLFSVIESEKAARAEGDAIELEKRIAEIVESQLARHLTPRTERQMFSIHGQGRFVHRAFGNEDISTDQSFELEHLLLLVSARIDDEFSLHFTPGASHRGGLFILEAFARYEATEWLALQGGRFLIPFNGIHAWAFPSDSFIEPFLPENSPRPFLYAPWWDEGLLADVKLPFGEDGKHTIRLAAYVINGFDPLGLEGFHKTNIGDNNENKTLGARASSTFRLGDETQLSIGAAGLWGKYDPADKLTFAAVELDLELRAGPFSVYVEAFHLASEIAGGVIENPAASHVDVSRLYGLKLRPQFRIDSNFSIFAQIDHLLVRQPQRMGGQFSVFALGDEETAITTYILGIKYEIAAGLRVQLEGGIFDRDKDLGDDIPFLATSLYFAF